MFFSTEPQYCLTFLEIEPQMLLNYCLLHRDIALPRHAIFSIFVSMPTSWPISVLSMRSILPFSLQLSI